MLRKLVLRLLSTLPLGIVSFAAKAALQDTVDQKAISALEIKLQRRRLMVIDEGISTSSIGDALVRFKRHYKGEDSDAEREFWKLIRDLEEKGLLQRHGEYLVAGGESHN